VDGERIEFKRNTRSSATESKESGLNYSFFPNDPGMLASLKATGENPFSVGQVVGKEVERRFSSENVLSRKEVTEKKR